MVTELRARGIGEILDTAVGLYRTMFVRLITLSAIVIIPLQVVTTIVTLSARSDSGVTVNFGSTSTTDANARDALIRLAASLVVLFLSFLANAFVVGLCTRPLADAYIRDPEQGQPARTPAPRGRVLMAVVITATLVGLCNVLGMFACGLGLVFPLTLFAVAVPIVVLEGVRPTRAMGRSFELTKSHFFHVLGLVVSAQLLGSIINLALTGAIGAWILGGSSETSVAIARGLAGVISSLLTLPFVTAAVVTLYFDLRIRNEGFDVQLMIQRNDDRHEQARVGTAALPMS